MFPSTTIGFSVDYRRQSYKQSALEQLVLMLISLCAIKRNICQCHNVHIMPPRQFFERFVAFRHFIFIIITFIDIPIKMKYVRSRSRVLAPILLGLYVRSSTIRLGREALSTRQEKTLR